MRRLIDCISYKECCIIYIICKVQAYAKSPPTERQALQSLEVPSKSVFTNTDNFVMKYEDSETETQNSILFRDKILS